MLHSRIGQATRQTWGRGQPDGDSGTPRAIRPECLTRSSVRRLYTIQGDGLSPLTASAGRWPETAF